MDSLRLKTCLICHQKSLIVRPIRTCENCRKKRSESAYQKKCSTPNCGHIPSFNFKGKKAIKCATHKKIGMINVICRKCAYQGCEKQPTFNTEGESAGKFCADHKTPIMVNVRDEKCSRRGCTTIPQFNNAGETRGKFCSKHKKKGMINVKRKRCPRANCSKTPHYNFKGETRGKFCVTHKEEGMIIVTSKTCEDPDCPKQPGFNFEGETQGRFCFDHKLEGMINVKNKLCEWPGCKKRAHCNTEGETRGKFCSNHKESDMMNVMNKKCSHPGCKKRPSFNDEGKGPGKFCSDHKQSNMINTKQKCERLGCAIIPTYNYKSETKGRFCFEHKEPTMVNATDKRKCLYSSGCATRAHYGIPGNQPSSCAKHKSEGMCKNPSARCRAEDCKEQALYGTYSPVHCEEHHEKNEVNMCLRKCKSCSSLEILNEEGFCFEYCINSDLYKRSKHHKEIRVQKFLQSEIKEEPYLQDKIVDSSCNKKRPDILYDCHTHFVAVEVDEHQHSSYNKTCELSRMKEICQAIGMPTIFIRYNPDHYKGPKFTKTKREKVLAEWVSFCMKPLNRGEPFLQVVYLFYDGFNSSDAKLDEIPML